MAKGPMRGKCQGAGGRLGNAWWAGDSQKTKTFQLQSAVYENLLFIVSQENQISQFKAI